MTSEARDRRIAILAMLAIGAAGTALPLLLGPGNAAAWAGAATPLVAFGGLWATTAALLGRTGSARWIAAFPRGWQVSVAALAVIGLTGFAVPIWSLWLAPLTWVAAGAIVLGVAAQDALITAVAAACGGVLLIVAPSWPLQLMEPSEGLAYACLVAAALLGGRAVVLAWGARELRTRPTSA
ncbi:hypothetical protein [Demequina muriae]|uniref:Uncharacterized protein n=1 Tax=Demequina muriae TaxID=3051664 RepID=A0ABT8GES0_9MICO|nr:hypothetical protein [Demequina sp. EGI L300058]MDN4479920.1 hypothetical protein [Demequina sp. EGI L300058]